MKDSCPWIDRDHQGKEMGAPAVSAAAVAMRLLNMEVNALAFFPLSSDSVLRSWEQTLPGLVIEWLRTQWELCVAEKGPSSNVYERDLIETASFGYFLLLVEV